MSMIVPWMDAPEDCSKCPFGVCRYSLPLTGHKHGFSCQVEFYEKRKYEVTREADYDDPVVPDLCPLKSVDGLIEEICNKVIAPVPTKTDIVEQVIGIIKEYCEDNK